MGIDLVAVNHLEAHALTVGLTEGLRPPYLLLLVSGGHTQLVVVHDVGRYTRLGTTIDDALGEAFDKTAKLLGLGFPGGPAVEQAARSGRPGRFPLPRPMLGRSGAAFLLRRLEDRRAPSRAGPGAAGRRRRRRPVRRLRAGRGRQRRGSRGAGHADRGGRVPGTCACGIWWWRVASRPTPPCAAPWRASRRRPAMPCSVPPPALCTDNAAMVAWAGAERLARGLTDGLDFTARARWPLDPDATPALGCRQAGRQGLKPAPRLRRSAPVVDNRAPNTGGEPA